jgi:hypothetical protein
MIELILVSRDIHNYVHSVYPVTFEANNLPFLHLLGRFLIRANGVSCKPYTAIH